MSPEKSQVIPSLIRKAIRYPDEEFVVWGSGKQRRAFVFVSDIEDALVGVATKGMNQGVIQIGPDYSTSIKEIAERVCAISGKQIDIASIRASPKAMSIGRQIGVGRAPSSIGHRERAFKKDSSRPTRGMNDRFFKARDKDKDACGYGQSRQSCRLWRRRQPSRSK